jgi:prepilin-type N-terminal cleavage/methylation domain-containing protein
MHRRAGFTLIEILIAVMLTGMVTSLALAPVVVTVRRVVELQTSTSGTLALSRALSFIGRDVAGTVRLTKQAVRVEDHQTLGSQEDDILAVMTTSPTRQQMPAGTVVYKIERGGSLRGVVSGLYRWVLPGKQVDEVEPEKLRGEDGQLVLPDVTGFSVEVPNGKEREKKYEGALPAGLAVALTRGTGKEAETLEEIIVSP